MLETSNSASELASKRVTAISHGNVDVINFHPIFGIDLLLL
jgi:hypothetical protein